MNQLLNKKFLIKDKLLLNGGYDWYMTFMLVGEDRKLQVIQEQTGAVLNPRTTCMCTYDINPSGKIYLCDYPGTPYNWMITSDNLSLWVAGQGGAMDFAMTFYEDVKPLPIDRREVGTRPSYQTSTYFESTSTQGRPSGYLGYYCNIL